MKPLNKLKMARLMNIAEILLLTVVLTIVYMMLGMSVLRLYHKTHIHTLELDMVDFAYMTGWPIVLIIMLFE